MLKTGLNRALMREILDNLDECVGRVSELFFDSTTYESEVISPIKPTQQEGSNEVVYLPRTRKGTLRSKTVIDKINDMNKKLVSKVTLRKIGKAKVDSEISVKAVNSVMRKRVEEVMDMGRGVDRLPGTDRKLTDVTMCHRCAIHPHDRTEVSQLKNQEEGPHSDWRDIRDGNTEPVWTKYPTRFQTILHEPWKGTRRRTADRRGT